MLLYDTWICILQFLLVINLLLQLAQVADRGSMFREREDNDGGNFEPPTSTPLAQLARLILMAELSNYMQCVIWTLH